MDSRGFSKYCILFIFIFVFYFGGSSLWSFLTKDYDTYVSGEITDEEILNMINDSNEVYLHRNKPYFGISYDVVVSDKKVGTIKGNFSLGWNHQMFFTSINGTELAKTDESFHLARSKWVVYSNENILNSLTPSLSLKNDYKILDKDGNCIGYYKTVFLSFFRDGYIQDLDREKVFNTSRDIIGSTRISSIKESDVSMLGATMMTTGFSHQNEKSSSTSSKSKSK